MNRYVNVCLAVALLQIVTAARRGSPCVSDDDCDGVLSCIGKETNMKCFMKKPRGMSCGVDPFWVCEDDLECEDHICKVPRGGGCTESDSVCVNGLSCIGNENKKKCFMPKGAGMQCGRDPFWVCADGLVCVDRVCRKAVGKGKRCGTRRVCKSRLVCAGPSRAKSCVIPGKPGRRCGMFDTCRGSTCVGGWCMA